uniref:F-box domain-containing protein n=1 Tax=Oryza glumipatula TaxID=40148 RepID=A0A0E0A218_9ORYZ
MGSVERITSMPRRQVQARDGSVASLAKRTGSPCQQEDDYEGAKTMTNPWTFLPEDIWYHIHSLLPLKDAARTACVSRTFLRSWRYRPNLVFSDAKLGLSGLSESDEVTKELNEKVDLIMKNHSGIGLRTFGLEYYNLVDASYLDRWLQIAVTPAIEELILMFFPEIKAKYYDFPFSLLFDRGGNSIKHLRLSYCAFRPTTSLNFLQRLHLFEVRITGYELGCLLSNSFALEQLKLTHCKELNYLKIPCVLQRLSKLTVFGCTTLQVIEIKAPNLSTFDYDGNLAGLSDGGLLPVKNLHLSSFYQHHTIQYTCAKLPSVAPTIETLTIFSESEVSQTRMKHHVICEDSSYLRQMPGHRHVNLKNVKIIGFCSAKSMVELTCHIIENATSLECLTLDTICDDYENPDRLSVHEIGECSPICRQMIMEAKNALLAIERYIVGKVPSTVRLDVLKPCSWCHAIEPLTPEQDRERARRIGVIWSPRARAPPCWFRNRRGAERAAGKKRGGEAAAAAHVDAAGADAATAADESVASLAKRNGSPCQQGDDYQGVKTMRNPWAFLPEDIWYHIHSLLPLQDAARTACVSQIFLRSWRCRPNLIFSAKTLGLNDNWLERNKVIGELNGKVDHIMKTTPRTRQTTTTSHSHFLFNRGGSSIKHLHLSYCVFHPTGGLNCLRSLFLYEVRITGHELGCLFSNSFALEQLELTDCKELSYLKIPCLLQRLSKLAMYGWEASQVMEIKAPNLLTFHYEGNLARLSDGGLPYVKNLTIASIRWHNAIYYACANLPSIVPTIETLTVFSVSEIINTPIAPLRFLHLKHLTVFLHTVPRVVSPTYDYLSLAYFLDASPALETFTLKVSQTRMEHDVISEDSSHLRQMPGHHHDTIKNVKIMVELTCHILENATSLEGLTLDTIFDGNNNPADRLSVHEVGRCGRIHSPMVMEAKNALLAIERYIVGKVPSTVKLDVLKPCSWCHTNSSVE